MWNVLLHKINKLSLTEASNIPILWTKLAKISQICPSGNRTSMFTIYSNVTKESMPIVDTYKPSLLYKEIPSDSSRGHAAHEQSITQKNTKGKNFPSVGPFHISNKGHHSFQAHSNKITCPWLWPWNNIAVDSVIRSVDLQGPRRWWVEDTWDSLLFI